jgi:hypothetical protein
MRAASEDRNALAFSAGRPKPFPFLRVILKSKPLGQFLPQIRQHERAQAASPYTKARRL